MRFFHSFICFVFLLGFSPLLMAHSDSTATEELVKEENPPGFHLFRRNKAPKYRYKAPKRRSSPSPASMLRLKSQSKRARSSMSHNHSRNTRHQKATWKRQRKQQSYSRRKNHFKHKPSRFDKRTKIKKIRRVYIMKTKDH